MNALFLKRFLRNPLQVASIMPSSRMLVSKVVSKVDFGQPRVIAEFGPGEGCHTRELVSRMCDNSKLLLFELDKEFAAHLRAQFAKDKRVEVINGDAEKLPVALRERGIDHCDYIISGIPFSILDANKKKDILSKAYDALIPASHAAFVIYQVTNELKNMGHCSQFAYAETEWCMINLPPMFITKFYRHAKA